MLNYLNFFKCKKIYNLPPMFSLDKLNVPEFPGRVMILCSATLVDKNFYCKEK